MTAKVASRFLLPTELFMGLYTILWGASGSGWFGHGTLYKALSLVDTHYEWGVVLCSLGLGMTLIALTEWFLGKPDTCFLPIPREDHAVGRFLWRLRHRLIGWMDSARALLSNERAVHIFVSMRSTLALLMMTAWIGAALMVKTAASDDTVALLYPAALLHTVFSWWIYVENLRVRYALNHEISTPTLRFER